MADTPEFRVGVLASGNGSTFEAAHEAFATGKYGDIEIAYIVCNNGPNNPDAGIWERARRLGVDIHHVSNKTQATCTLPEIKGKPVDGTISYEASERMAALAIDYGIDMKVALGFMRKIVGKVLQRIPIANVHHGPLPETAGEHGIGIDKAVMRQGLDYSGPTFHWMDKRVDENGLPMYDLDEDNLELLIGHQPVPVTDDMRQEWRTSNTAKLLQAEDMRVEKLYIPGWIQLALEQL